MRPPHPAHDFVCGLGVVLFSPTPDLKSVMPSVVVVVVSPHVFIAMDPTEEGLVGVIEGDVPRAFMSTSLDCVGDVLINSEGEQYGDKGCW